MAHSFSLIVYTPSANRGKDPIIPNFKDVFGDSKATANPFRRGNVSEQLAIDKKRLINRMNSIPKIAVKDVITIQNL